MFDIIKKRYESFSDSLITDIRYKRSVGKGMVELYVRAMNATDDYNFELIKLTFQDVQKFRLLQLFESSSFVIDEALLIDDNGIITFDFFPEICDDDSLKEDPNSDLLIKCRKVIFEIIGE